MSVGLLYQMKTTFDCETHVLVRKNASTCISGCKHDSENVNPSLSRIRSQVFAGVSNDKFLGIDHILSHAITSSPVRHFWLIINFPRENLSAVL